MRKTILRWLDALGYRVTKRPRYRRARLERTTITDVQDLVEDASSIPGMLPEETGRLLYALCYMQETPGDVVEVGSWQGYSTSFLARAVMDSKNGRLYAVDHFKGNLGKESRYVVGKTDLSDLKDRFAANMERLGLREHVRLLAMPGDRAAEELVGHEVRFLFIDGDHTRAGVENDIRLFFPLLVPGAIVVFDDFTGDFPGLVEALDRLIAESDFRRVYALDKTLVLRI